MASGPTFAEGRYVCEVLNQALCAASTGTSQFLLQFRVLGTPDPKNPENYVTIPNQAERTHYRAITENTINYFIEDLKTLGFQGSSFKELDPGSSPHHSFAGQIVDMFCKHEKNNKGELREKWGVARPVGQFEVEPLDAAKVRELDNLFGKQLRAAIGRGPAATQKARANAAPQPPDIGEHGIGPDDAW